MKLRAVPVAVIVSCSLSLATPVSNIGKGCAIVRKLKWDSGLSATQPVTATIRATLYFLKSQQSTVQDQGNRLARAQGNAEGKRLLRAIKTWCRKRAR